ncbi:MAG: hypothetical protein RSL74_10145, partial [Clostridium sp.]
MFKQNMDGKGLSWFKGIITAIERSNNFTFQWNKENNEKTLAGKKFGGIFWRRQYEKDNGDRPIITELWRIRSVAGLSEAEIPEDNLLPEKVTTSASVNQGAPIGDGFMTIPISIHRALASPDCIFMQYSFCRRYFNPQGSREPRHQKTASAAGSVNFNPQGSREPRLVP